MKLLTTFCLTMSVCSLWLTAQTPVVIDMYKTYQTITGFGGHNTNGQSDLVNDDLGATVERIWLDPAFKTSSSASYNFDAACSPSKADILAEKANGVKIFMATPWSPPGWMKVNGTENGGVASTNVLKSDMYETYANYLVEYAKMFKAQIGIDLYAISMQNEPRFDEPYPSCIYTPTQMRDLVKLVGPKLKTAGLTTTIICAEDMGSYPTNTPWFQAILGDPDARKYVGVWAVHGYSDGVAADGGSAPGWTSMADYVKAYDIPLWMTETSGYWNNWTDAMKLGQAIHLALRHGKISAWFWWRTVILSSQASFWEDEALVIGTTPNKTYYSSKNYYKYIRPGAQQIESSCTDADIMATAFIHGAEKSLTMVLINKNASNSKTLSIQGDKIPTNFNLYTSSSSKNFTSEGSKTTSSFTLPANSINTLVFTGSNKQPTIDKIDTVAFLMKKPGVTANYSVNITGISDGGSEGQTISISETHTNATWFTSFASSYTSPATTGKLNFTPKDNQSGYTDVTVTVSDGSTANNSFLSTQKMTFVLKLIPFVNSPPTVDNITNWKTKKENLSKSVYLTGITDGNDGTQKLSLTAVSSNTSIVNTVYVKNISGTTAEINYRPLALGTATITLTVIDDGGADLGGNDTKIMTFTIEVLETYDNEFMLEDHADIFPNPASEYITITNNNMAFHTASIVDNSGIIRSTHKLASENCLISIKELNAGIYFVKLMGDKEKIIKLLVQ